MTAGNACPLNDGAAALLIMSDEKAKAAGLQPRARIVASTVAGLRPEVMGVGPIPAIQKLLKSTGMTISDIDVVEINEAFAAQIVPCKQELEIPDEKLNPFGGAIALGHPFRDDRRADHDDAAERPRHARRHLWHRVDVRSRRDGHGDACRTTPVIWARRR